MHSLEIVVAHYREDLRWLRRVPREFRVTIYDKGGSVRDAIPLENVGHEAHTYLHHLVSRYDALADVTVFCQGKPFDHVPDLHRRLRRLARGGEAPETFRWLGFIIDWDDPEGRRLFQTWDRNTEGRALRMDAFWRALWDELPPARLVFYPGAHFIVRAATVRGRPRAFYERALALSATFPDAGHCFERCWDRVFGCDGIPEDCRGRELPIYLRPIRRLGLTWDSVPPEERGWGE